MKPIEFKSLCEAWNRENMRVFPKIIESAEAVGFSQRELALKFAVAESTVHRWKTEHAQPHPRVQQYIVSYLKKKAETIIRASEEVPALTL